MTIRKAHREDVESILAVLSKAFGTFHNETDSRTVLASPRFQVDGCFIAEENRSPVGCVAVTSLPRAHWFVIRYLAVSSRKRKPEIAEELLATARDYARSVNAQYVRAATPATQPYVDVYKEHGFVPVRRDFRISWDLAKLRLDGAENLRAVQVSQENSAEAAKVFVRSLSPLWDWRTEEQGGEHAFADSFLDGLKHGEKWLLFYADDSIVGLTGLIPDFYGPGKARFRGAYVVQEHRGKGFGLRVMNEGIDLAKNLGQKSMVIYTFSNLDALAPGPSLYLRSRGRIECEYLQLFLQ